VDDDDACMADKIGHFSTDLLPLSQRLKHISTGPAVAGTDIGLHMDKCEALHLFLGQSFGMFGFGHGVLRISGNKKPAEAGLRNDIGFVVLSSTDAVMPAAINSEACAEQHDKGPLFAGSNC